jgi:hypothetical protein
MIGMIAMAHVQTRDIHAGFEHLSQNLFATAGGANRSNDFGAFAGTFGVLMGIGACRITSDKNASINGHWRTLVGNDLQESGGKVYYFEAYAPA